MNTFKPMLSASLDGVDLATLKYPLVVSPKLDGIRCLIINGIAYSRNMKPIRNEHIQEWARRSGFDGFDGELVVGSPTAPDCMNVTQSGVMSLSGEPEFTYWVFDDYRRGPHGFWEDYQHQLSVVGDEDSDEFPNIQVVHHSIVYNVEELLAYEEEALALGYEGIMLRSPNGPYKNGRSTLREGYLMKLKRFMDGEGVVIRLEEAMENQNEMIRDELGRAKRSSHKENKAGKGMIGTIVIQDDKWGEMRLSPGIMTHAERMHWWSAGGLVGKRVHWRAFGYGVKDKPRFPRFYGFPTDKE